MRLHFGPWDRTQKSQRIGQLVEQLFYQGHFVAARPKHMLCSISCSRVWSTSSGLGPLYDYIEEGGRQGLGAGRLYSLHSNRRQRLVAETYDKKM